MPFITQGKTNWKLLLIVIILAIIVGGGALCLFKKETPTPVNLGPAPYPNLSIWIKDSIPYSWMYTPDVNSISITFSGVQIHLAGDSESVWSSQLETKQNTVDLVKIENSATGIAIAFCPLPSRRVDSLKIMISDAEVTIGQTQYNLSVPSTYQTGIKIPVAYGNKGNITVIALTIDLDNSSLHENNHVFNPTVFEAKSE